MSKPQLIEAARAGSLAAVRELLKSGADVNEEDEQGWTAIKFAAGRGDMALVELLRRCGADIDGAGRDQRSPYMVALAAGHVEVARFLREEAARASGSPAQQPRRSYCRAYHLSQLSRFAGWRERVAGSEGDRNSPPGDGQATCDDPIVYIHQDYTMMKSMWPDEGHILTDIDQPWIEFCQATLGFIPPDELDLVCSEAVGAGD